jgi:hypothetical protein
LIGFKSGKSPSEPTYAAPPELCSGLLLFLLKSGTVGAGNENNMNISPEISGDEKWLLKKF